MIRVSNRRYIGHLARRTLRARHARNSVAVFAIALTTVLFPTLFTLALSINEGMQQSNFRQVGTYSHGGFKYLTKAQMEQLRDDPLIRQWGVRRFLGTPTGEPFTKAHVEISYADENYATWMFCVPQEGRLPEEGTDQAATDTRVLELLGVEPELGAEFTLTFSVDGHTVTETFTLSGWWEYDEAVVANHVLLPQSRVDEILQQAGVDPNNPADGMTGTWNLDVMLASSLHIAEDFEQILQNHGYQDEERSEEGYVDTGVNWGYAGAQLAENLDPVTVIAIAVILLVIIFTGYLIIYNVFQISVAGDIRYYGLLKTIGVTPRQLRRLIRYQALLLSLAGIPLGLLLGYLVGAKLTPIVIGQLDGVDNLVSLHPLIFVASALFALFTVLLSTGKPGRMAARVSPIEAVRYAEGGSKTGRKKRRRGHKNGASLPAMAWANLGRSRTKTAVTILSLTLSVTLLQMTVTLSRGLDMDKYIAANVVSDFLVADAGQFQTGGETFHAGMGLPQSALDDIAAQGGITDGGRVYGATQPAQEWITEDYFRQLNRYFGTDEELDSRLHFMERSADGRVATDVELYGMEPYALDRLTVLEGDLAPLSDPGSNSIAAVYAQDDYGRAEQDSHWARLGDTVTLRYVEQFEYYNPNTGEVYPEDADLSQLPYATRATKWREVTYTVVAIVTVPTPLSYRYYGNDEFVLGAEQFRQDTGTDSVMYYAFDVADGDEGAMTEFLQDYTQNVNPQLDYESKEVYAQEFESMRSMFLMLGGTMSAIVGLVGVLNFFNAILTGILARRRELAILQSIGMTGRQLKRMLTYEGLLYTLGSVLASLVLSLVVSPLMGRALNSLFWFFSFDFTLLPVLAAAPVFALLGLFIPRLTYAAAVRRTVVDRLRETEV